ncbi:hypothetical protein EV175_003837 [Coemansia sp. RSA 1933]|nr:hypothetical protein EV175_003837 [Coemansia sp. RSA 1933]
MHLQASQNCAFKTNQTNVSSLDTMQSPSLGLAAIVSWDEAVAAGCYSYAQFIQNLHEAGVDSELDIREVIFGSAIDNDAVLFGSPIVEPYGDIGHTDSGLSMTLTSASTARLLLADILQSTMNNATLQIVQELGPWNILAQATGFKAQKYTFLAVSIILILYTFWEIGLMLCTLTVWNRRMLMYLSAIGYLVVFALLHPYNINSRNSQMTIYVFWIIGYLSFTLFIISWGSMVEKIHTRAVVILMHHRKIHYGAAVLVSLSILLKLWAYAAESYQFSSIADSIVKYELPVTKISRHK